MTEEKPLRSNHTTAPPAVDRNRRPVEQPSEPQRDLQPDPPAVRDPSEISVDHLTQAFASLLGDPETPAAAEAQDAQRSGEDETASTKAGADGRQPGSDAEANSSTQASPAAQGPRSSADEDADDPTPLTPSSIVEAILFVGHPDNQPISARLIASYLRGVSPDEVDELIVQLNEVYQSGGYPMEIVSEGEGYRMVLRREFNRVREAFYGRVREAKLSQAAIDLLAIVAYRQPISRDEIDELRGQPSGSILNQLVRRELLAIEYTSEKPRKKQYRTTDRFLELFGLESLDDLPHHEDAAEA